MSLEKNTYQPSTANLREALTNEITEEVRQTLSQITKEEIVCVAIVDKNSSVEILTISPVKIMKEEPSVGQPPSDESCSSSVQDPSFAWEKTPQGCLWLVTLVKDVQNGVWVENSRKCVYDVRNPACPVGTSHSNG